MLQLLIVSILWAVSFGLTKQVAPLGGSTIAAARILLSLLVFLPFMRLRGLSGRQLGAFAGIGALEFGLMYVLYTQSYTWLNPAEVALFTIFTPLFVTLFDDLLERRISWLFLGTASVAVLGTAICLWTQLERAGLVTGFVVMQASNACFAMGQVLYRRAAPKSGKKDHELMALLYFGGALIASAAAFDSFDPAKLAQMTSDQAAILLYLGMIASGVGFFLFNSGARRVNVGTLAIFNNAKVPLAILASALLFQAEVSWPNILAGGIVIAAALILNEWGVRRLRQK